MFPCHRRMRVQGRMASCQTSMFTTTATPVMRELLTTTKATTQSAPSTTKSTTTTTTLAPVTTTVAKVPVTYISVSTSTVKVTSPTPSTVHSVVNKNLESAHKNDTINFFTTFNPIATEVTKRFLAANSVYNKTESTTEITKTILINEAPTPSVQLIKTLPTLMPTSSSIKPVLSTTPKTNLTLPIKEVKENVETTRKPETTLRSYPTTLKFKPKEIWIKPAQKGESPILEIKPIPNHEVHHMKHKHITKKELESTTPKTIIVSIIPTSVSYATFKKIALATVPYMAQKNSTVMKSYSQIIEEFTKSMSVQTSTSVPFKKLNTLSLRQGSLSTTTSPASRNVTKSLHTTLAPTKGITKVNSKTNSMSSTFSVNPNYTPNFLTTISSINTKPTTRKRNMVTTHMPKGIPKTTQKIITNKKIDATQRNKTVTFITKEQSDTKPELSPKKSTKVLKNAPGMSNNTKFNVSNDSNSKTNTVTDQPKGDEEVFHILTEPEHITAVMGEKGTDRTSVDLVSVISIAGGVMMAIITVAVIIVMIERCKRPRYEDVRKINDIRMQVMIDKNDVPPPYVRSIFHTPLPDPPTSEKCHYQPISTLDRNLKQFMRPVVVQTISPIMLENFRGILECHYDHLPRRDHEFGTMPIRGTATSINYSNELRAPRAYSVTESTIEALKCEAKLDVIDTTTSEPLYAEIPCWRPPSEHAIEVINTNGEAVTEL
ncbi:mucin-2-like isoform X2 [Achroia grisella]|uniref:mucin-2-like isoform X2 n=1 Tax=Achroia grisella TaxID=688607 RepID=UPI0027D34D6D|nr:mucin-2-like isoform X2 [Achroia grisella]